MKKNQKKIHKWPVKTGDVVEVIAGNYKGKEGKIIRVNRSKLQVYIENVRMISKHQRASQKYPQGGIIHREGPLHLSNVQLKSEV